MVKIQSNKKGQQTQLQSGTKILVAGSCISAFKLLEQGASALADFNEQRTEARYEEFCRTAFEGKVFPENADNMSADELMGMLRLCLADIEQAKAGLYGRLACSIASKRVADHLRHPLMVVLAELTLAQVQRLRGAWMAREFKLIPKDGPQWKSTSEFLGTHEGETAHWDLQAFARYALVDKEVLTSLASALVEACFLPSELIPQAIGEQAWLEGHLPVISEDLGNEGVVSFSRGLKIVARERGLRIGDLHAPKDVNAAKGIWINAVPAFVIVVYARPKPASFSKILQAKDIRGKKPLLVFLDERSNELESLLPHSMVLEKPSCTEVVDWAMRAIAQPRDHGP